MKIIGKMATLINVPEGKESGICEMPKQTDGGQKVLIDECANKCGVGPVCLMFGEGEVLPGGKMEKQFTSRRPEF